MKPLEHIRKNWLLSYNNHLMMLYPSSIRWNGWIQYLSKMDNHQSRQFSNCSRYSEEIGIRYILCNGMPEVIVCLPCHFDLWNV